MVKPLQALMQQYPQRGEVSWIGLRSAKKADLTVVDSLDANTETGLVGDHYAGRTGKRHATLIQAEHLSAIASYLGIESIAPALLRRNILVRGINLLALKDKTARIGSAEFEITGLCHPCSRMEQILGTGGYNAVRGHGGVTARVISNGTITVGDSVSYFE